MRNVIVAILLFILLGVVGALLLNHWWSARTTRLPVEQNVIATSQPTTAPPRGVRTRPLAPDEREVSLPSQGTLPAGTIRYTPTVSGVTFTVLVSSDVPKTAIAWVIPAKGPMMKIGKLQEGKEGLFVDGTLTKSQLPAHIVITTATGKPTVAGEALFDTILSL